MVQIPSPPTIELSKKKRKKEKKNLCMLEISKKKTFRFLVPFPITNFFFFFVLKSLLSYMHDVVLMRLVLFSSIYALNLQIIFLGKLHFHPKL